jgi:hypothetical protein
MDYPYIEVFFKRFDSIVIRIQSIYDIIMSLIYLLHQIIGILRQHDIRIRDIRREHFADGLILSRYRPVDKDQIGVDGFPARKVIQFENIPASSYRLVLLPYPIQLGIGIVHSEVDNI